MFLGTIVTICVILIYNNLRTGNVSYKILIMLQYTLLTLILDFVPTFKMQSAKF